MRPSVRFLRVPQELSRSELDRLETFAKEWGAKGLAYLVFDEEGEVRSPIAKFLSEEELAYFRGDPATTVLFGADEPDKVARVLGALRLHLGRELGLIDESRDEFLWVTDFPLFEWNEEEQRWNSEHHPVHRACGPGDEELLEKDPAKVVSQSYDLVWNGWELGSGSIRIHRQDVQERVFRVLGIEEEEAQQRFGFLLEVMRMGAPPHGGFGFGDRPLPGPARRRAEHPRGDRLPEIRQRLRADDRRTHFTSRGSNFVSCIRLSRERLSSIFALSKETAYLAAKGA